ncbi:unnamed protein product [Alopecurus aequalis]
MLPDELLEEIFLRLPPDEPELLVRASLASKLWLGRLTTPRFHGRYREFHTSPPMLGFFYSDPYINEEPPFVSTTKFRVRIPDPENMWYSAYDAWDCRHGRVLLGCSDEELTVLDPITGYRSELVAPRYYSCFGAAVLCAVNGCDHRACHGGLSRVVFVGVDIIAAGFVAYAYESLQETDERSKPHSRLRQWSKPSSGLLLGPFASIELVPPVLIQDTLYFKLVYDDDHVEILSYDLCSKCLSLIDAPLADKHIAHITILMGMEDGSLGFAHLDWLTLNLWSRQMGPDGVGSWTECRGIDLDALLPGPKIGLRPIGHVEGGDIIFMTMELGIYEINLKSLEWKKIWKIENFHTLVPYMSFYYPQGRASPCDAAH